MLRRIEVFPVPGVGEIVPGTDLVREVSRALSSARITLQDGDIVVIKQKIVSKSEGRLVELASVRPSARAKKMAKEQSKDPRLMELILRESIRVVRQGHGVVITETKHGFVCANSGVDQSNVAEGYVALLPADPDASARKIRSGLEEGTGRSIAVVITDTFGRPWRMGQTDVAIGCSGIVPLVSYTGKKDRYGYELRVTEPSVVDEVAGAAELATGKLRGIPAAIVRGVEFVRGEAGVQTMLMEKSRDLFR